ncbi:MAG TPA: deoxyribodipyrimidine photolyase [Thermoguttaceae bacterium]|nr:deoxyribodipyrimidine photolyase [Thermoguttaceae bacterium]
MSPKAPTKRVPPIRVTPSNDAAVNPQADYVLYWMTASRRTTWNFALERAVEWAGELGRPLVIAETLASGCRWASDRHHAMVLEGMAENAAVCARHGVRYYPYAEAKRGEGIDLVVALAARACIVVTDDFPISSVVVDAEQVARRVKVAVERVDSNGLLPLRAADRVFPTAYAFRRFLHRTLPDHLPEVPEPNALARLELPRLRSLPGEITSRWPPASTRLLAAEPAALASLPIDHEVAPARLSGGPTAARKMLKRFLQSKLPSYAEDRNHPGVDGTSGLSPYLHFGHVSVHEVFHELAQAEGWSPTRLAEKATGKREGWWGTSEPAEAFLDELITWREVGFNMCARRSDYDQYDSLPDWAQKTLDDHAGDDRPYVYWLEEFEAGRTHDPLWNAAQTEIVRTGRMHNYVRMLWGKKILEWSAGPREALDVMIELNNKYGLDGQDPNSYSGIFWVLGRYDRPWGPERPIFGKIRYMSSDNTARKLRLGDYLKKHAPDDE